MLKNSKWQALVQKLSIFQIRKKSLQLFQLESKTKINNSFSINNNNNKFIIKWWYKIQIWCNWLEIINFRFLITLKLCSQNFQFTQAHNSKIYNNNLILFLNNTNSKFHFNKTSIVLCKWNNNRLHQYIHLLNNKFKQMVETGLTIQESYSTGEKALLFLNKLTPKTSLSSKGKMLNNS